MAHAMRPARRVGVARGRARGRRARRRAGDGESDDDVPVVVGTTARPVGHDGRRSRRDRAAVGATATRDQVAPTPSPRPSPTTAGSGRGGRRESSSATEFPKCGPVVLRQCTRSSGTPASVASRRNTRAAARDHDSRNAGWNTFGGSLCTGEHTSCVDHGLGGRGELGLGDVAVVHVAGEHAHRRGAVVRGLLDHPGEPVERLAERRPVLQVERLPDLLGRSALPARFARADLVEGLEVAERVRHQPRQRRADQQVVVRRLRRCARSSRTRRR